MNFNQWQPLGLLTTVKPPASRGRYDFLGSLDITKEFCTKIETTPFHASQFSVNLNQLRECVAAGNIQAVEAILRIDPLLNCTYMAKLILGVSRGTPHFDAMLGLLIRSAPEGLYALIERESQDFTHPVILRDYANCLAKISTAPLLPDNAYQLAKAIIDKLKAEPGLLSHLNYSPDALQALIQGVKKNCQAAKFSGMTTQNIYLLTDDGLIDQFTGKNYWVLLEILSGNAEEKTVEAQNIYSFFSQRTQEKIDVSLRSMLIAGLQISPQEFETLITNDPPEMNPDF